VAWHQPRQRFWRSVTSVGQQDHALVVTGNEYLVQVVMAWLSGEGIVAEQLRVDQPTLDDAFIALTGRSLDEADEETAGR
jgi:ABC-2 type transport system ATP-binding protein